MTSDSIIAIVGAVVTVLGMIITIWQASQVRRYKSQIKSDIRKIDLTNIIDQLKRALEDIRRLPTSTELPTRGIRPKELIHKTRGHFDLALGTLGVNGPDASVREILAEAQSKLNSYEISWNSGNPDALDVHALQEKLQNAVSTITSTIYEIEGKI